MKRSTLLFVLIFLGLLPTSVFAQFGTVGVYAYGAVPTDRADGSRLAAPGLAVRVGESGRFTVEGSYLSQMNLSASSQHVMLVGVGEGTSPPREVVGHDVLSSSSFKMLTGSFLVNILTKGPIRPFVGAGSGLALKTNTIRFSNLTGTEEYRRVYGRPFEYFGSSDGETRNTKNPVGRATVGIKISPASHFVISPSVSEIVGKGIKFRFFSVGAGFNF